MAPRGPREAARHRCRGATFGIRLPARAGGHRRDEQDQQYDGSAAPGGPEGQHSRRTARLDRADERDTRPIPAVTTAAPDPRPEDQ